jgi:hypothetical protein
MQSESVRIPAPAVVAERFHPSNSDAEIDQAFTPGTAEGIGDNHGNFELGAFFQIGVKLASGMVRVGGQKHGVSATIYVGDINPTVCADKAVLGFGDEHSMLSTDYGAAFAQSKLDHARVQIVLIGPRFGFNGRFYRGKIDYATLCFGNNLVLDDDNVACLE